MSKGRCLATNRMDKNILALPLANWQSPVWIAAACIRTRT